jgi:hypothetical protein
MPPMRRTLAWVGLVLWVVAWFVPVIKGQDTVDTIKSAFTGKDDGPPGWAAFRTAWDLLRKGDEFKETVLGLTSLTNVAFVVAAVWIVRNRPNAVIGNLLLISAALNLSWVYLNLNDADDLRAGYWLWAVSFAVAGFGLTGSSSKE